MQANNDKKLLKSFLKIIWTKIFKSHTSNKKNNNSETKRQNSIRNFKNIPDYSAVNENENLDHFYVIKLIHYLNDILFSLKFVDFWR